LCYTVWGRPQEREGGFAVTKRIGIAVLFLVILVAGWVVHLYWVAGQFKTIEPHFSGKCKAVAGVAGPEDITIHPKTGVAFVSGCDRRAIQEGGAGGGAIFAYDLNAVTSEPVNLTPDADRDFRPHGISLFVGESGDDVLFVINHQGGEHRIDVFDLKQEGLIHRETLTSPMLVSPNDIVAVGPDRFYVTNDHRYPSGWKCTMEDYLRLRLSNVVFYDGSEFVQAASGIGYANGINVSPDGRTLYVCSITEGGLYVYNRDPVSGRLEHRAEMDLDTGVDNVEVDAEGDLWIGAHPQLLTTMKHFKNRWALSPSQVIRLTPRAGGGYDVEEVYLDTGEEISASSVAAVRGNRLLIGAILESKFLDCRM
jgi:arylesterase/paraoxonase